MEATKVIFWDFDGTLGHRNGFFSEVLLEILDKYEPTHEYKINDIRIFLKDKFPWHMSNDSHFELNDPALWWDFVEKIFIQAYEGIGFENEKAMKYAKLAHLKYIDSRGFSLYEDTEETLKYFVDRGYKNIILSNHVPELSFIVRDLGLYMYIHDCISSANIGYEKPNPEIFKYALREAGNPEEVWMVGDNFIADVKGAEKLGIKAILVRSNFEDFEEEIKYYGKKLLDVIPIIENN